MIWRCYYKRMGQHIHCRLFSGPIEGALGMNGSLTFRVEDWIEFVQVKRVLAMDFRREVNLDGSPAGDDLVPFDRPTLTKAGWK